jgi:hypothetical protein
MKFTTLKTILFLYLLFSNFSSDFSMKLRRKRKAKSLLNKSKLKLSKEQKLKAFFIGFVSSSLAKLIEGKETDNPDTRQTVVSNVVESCTPVFLNSYDTVIQNNKSESGYNEAALRSIFNDREINEILPICNKQEALNKLDDNEYSSLNVITGWLVDVFKKNPYFADYRAFKAEKEANKIKVDELSKKYKLIVNERKVSIQDSKAKSIAEKISKDLDGILFDDTICEVMNKFYEISFFDHLEALLVAAMKGLVCGNEIVLKTFAEIKLTKLLENVFVNFGISMAQGTLAAAFPPALAAYVIGFLWKNMADLTKISKFLILPGSENQERDLYQSIGSIAANQIIGLVI